MIYDVIKMIDQGRLLCDLPSAFTARILNVVYLTVVYG